jgi:hypothetical protein
LIFFLASRIKYREAGWTYDIAHHMVLHSINMSDAIALESLCSDIKAFGRPHPEVIHNIRRVNHVSAL